MPATWGGVTNGTSAAKAKVLYSYKDAVANKETIAGYVPSRRTRSRTTTSS